jgi:hypothetical protein
MSKMNSGASFLKVHPRWMDALISAGVAILIALFCSSSLSPLFQGDCPSGMNMDSDLFRYSAWLWIHGGTPYIDFYDHKGLYHLAIDALGLYLGGRYGIWALEILFYWADFLILIPMVRYLFGDAFRYRVAFYAVFTALSAFVLEGNLEGEWVLPFASLFVSFYIRGIKGGSDRAFYWGSFFMGLNVGLALNSRPVDGLYGAIGALFCLVYSWRHHKWLFLLYNALIAIAGCGLPFAIIYPLVEAQGFLPIMLKAVFVQNASYLSQSFVGITPLVWGYKALAFGAFLVHLLFYFLERRYRPEEPELAFFFVFVGGIASLLFVLLLGFGHYFQSGFGFLALGILFGFTAIPLPKKYPAIHLASWGSGLYSLIMVIVFLVGYWSTADGIQNFSHQNTEEFETTVAELKAAGAGSKSDVYAIDSDCAVYLQGEFVVNERYMAFQRNWTRDNEAVLPEIRSYLEGDAAQAQPGWLIVDKRSESFKKVADIVAKEYEVSSIKNSLFDIYVLKA